MTVVTKTLRSNEDRARALADREAQEAYARACEKQAPKN